MLEGIEVCPYPADMEQVHLYHQGAANAGHFAGVPGGRLRLQTGPGVSCDGVPARREQQYLVGLMRKGRLSLAEAKEKYPDWYERRIVKKERRGRWTVKRDLYDWWLHRIGDEIRVGHRFYGIMTLAIYAKKCGISEDELRRDAFTL